MKSWSLGDFAQRARAELVGDKATQFADFSWDSRQVTPGSLFLCIRGAQVDGHDFAEEAARQGAAALLCERQLATSLPQVVAPNLVEALASFGRSVRDEYSGPVIGITGSNGKTSCKEFTAQALSPLGPILKNEGNRNTEYTNPLIWAELDGHPAVVSEMAMRGLGQIDHLARIAKPTIAVITMIGTAHAELVGSRQGIVLAKGEILASTSGPAILWQEDDFLGDLKSMARGPVRTFGFSSDADCQIMGYQVLDWQSSRVLFTLGGDRLEGTIPTVGRHQALNAAAALLVAAECGVPLDEAVSAMSRTQLPGMRMEPRWIGNTLVLMDNYNASPDSTIAALRTLTELPVSGRRIAVLGEMRELGQFTESGHRLVGQALIGSSIDQVVFYGDLTRGSEAAAIEYGYPASQIFRAESMAELSDFLKDLPSGDVVLIKGSRALGLEAALPEVSAR